MSGMTVSKLQGLKPRAKLFRVADAGGLCIEVHPSGAKYWRFRYRFAGKQKMISLGTFPEQSLAEARDARDEARGLLRKGSDPSFERQRARQDLRTSAANTFESIALEYIDRKLSVMDKSTVDKADAMLKTWAYPWIGVRPITEITAGELLTVLRRVEERGKIETAHRLLQRCSQVFRYAIATSRAERDTAADLRGALKPVQTTHRASITDPKALADLLRAMWGYQGAFVTACALKLSPLLFVRPGELRRAEWSEIDLEASQWKIPAAKMKMRSPHIVPLSDQAVALLSELHPLTGRGMYVFPGARSNKSPMSENTIVAALRRLGYEKGQMTAHGFRSIASTRLHEMGFQSHLIERQLAHVERNGVKAAYNHAEYLAERQSMMQAWADYLDTLREGRKVVAGKFGKAA